MVGTGLTTPDGARRRGSGLRGLWLVWAMFIGVIIATGGAAIWHLHSAALSAAQREMASLSVALAAQTTRSFGAVDLALRGIQAQVAVLGPHTPAALREQAANRNFQTMLASRMVNLPQVAGFVLTDAEGMVLSASAEAPTSAIASLARNQLRHLQAGDQGFVSGPEQDLASGRSVIAIARRIDTPDGALLGLAVGLIDTERFTALYQSLDMPVGQSIGLQRNDGTLVAGHHDPASSVVAVHDVRDYSLAIHAAMSRDAALEGSRDEIIAVVAARGGIALAFTALFGVIATQFRHQQGYAKALAHSERQVRDFAEISSDWFWEQDTDFRFRWLSPSALDRLPPGRTYVGATRWELAGENGTEPRWQAHQADLAARRPFRDLRYQIRGSDGAVRHVTTSGLAMFDDAGSFVGYRGTARDITAEVAVADELRRSKEAAESASRAKSEFLANMSHELRTPLNAIIGFSELMQNSRAGRSSNEHIGWAGDILASGRHLLDVINDVLQLAQIEAGRYSLADDRVDLALAARSCIGMMRLQAETKRIAVRCTIIERTAVLRADNRAVKQILLNLLGNAVKFTPAGGAVSIGVEPTPNGSLRLVVTDTGIGIDPAALASLCEPFTQADASISRTYGGTGLGLSISRKLAALHDAELTIGSLPGKGTTVRVGFPAGRVLGRPQQALAAAT